MKHINPTSVILPVLAVLLTCMQSCVSQDLPEERVNVQFTVLNPATKAGPVDQENAVNSLDIFVIRKSDDLVCAHERSSGPNVYVRIPKDITVRYIICANLPEDSLKEVLTGAGLDAAIADLSTVTACGFPMRYADEAVFTTDATKDVQLERLMSKVSIKGITCQFMDTYLGNTPATLNAIWLINAAGSSRWDATADPSARWYNARVEDTSLASSVRPYLRVDLSRTVTSSATDDTEYCLYAFPNTYTESTAPYGSTRLVIDMTIAGTRYYYPITLPVMQPNRNYIIRKVTLRFTGSTDPNEKVELVDIDFLLSILPWGSVDKDVVID